MDTVPGVPPAGEDPSTPTGNDDGRARLRADCANCFGLCCVALPFTASADFAVTKKAGEPCVNLRADFRCGIHAHLRRRGFPDARRSTASGGQKVSRITFDGQNWRPAPRDVRRRMFEVFPAVRQLHELLWYITEALELPPARCLHDDLSHALDGIERLTFGPPEALAGLRIGTLRDEVNVLLLRASELSRAAVPGGRRNLHGADLIGARLGGGPAGANLRGAYLIAADLTDADCGRPT